VFLWAAISVFIGALTYHTVILTKCRTNFRADICFSLFYSWGVYAIALAVAMTVGILLHYAYVDPHKVEDDDSSGDEIVESHAFMSSDGEFE
jgi:hypothetical protein